jgi:hypothetical protein
MESKKEIVKQYFAMHKEMFKETQFNRKVELNVRISKFKKENKIDVLGQEPLYEIFVGDGIDKDFIGQIVCKYGSKKKDLSRDKIGYDYKLINN